jgi:hypothetical protein
VVFVVTLGLHIGIVLFVTLTAALAIYAAAATLANMTSGIQVLAWMLTVISLAIWAQLVKAQARGLRPHIIRGLGKELIATSGCERGEIAADLGTALIGLAQIVPPFVTRLRDEAVPERLYVLTALIGGLLMILGLGSLTLRLWLGHIRPAQRASESEP